MLCVACEFENMAPSGSEFQLNNQVENILLEAPDTLIFTGTFEDDVSLNNYFLSITPTFDTISSISRQSIFPFIFQDSFPLIGTFVREFREILVPATAMPGMYSFEISFADEENQVGPMADFTVIIENPAPLIVLEAPTIDTIELAVMDMLAIEGQVIATDAPLDSISISISRAINDTTIQSLFSQIFSRVSANINTELQDFSFSIIPANTDTGEFTLSIFAIDNLNHSGEIQSLLVIE